MVPKSKMNVKYVLVLIRPQTLVGNLGYKHGDDHSHLSIKVIRLTYTGVDGPMVQQGDM
jgi:hypothetical protein